MIVSGHIEGSFTQSLLKVKTRVCAHRASVPSGPHAMLPTESILFLFDRFEHKWRWVHGFLDGGQLTVLLEVNAAVCAQ